MRKSMLALAGIFLVMLGLPWAAVTFAPGDAAMAICFVLFFAVDPVCSLLTGVYAGLAVKRRWYLPLVNAGAFLASAWALFDPGEPVFLWYAAAYLAVGVLAMAVGAYVCRMIRRYQEPV